MLPPQMHLIIIFIYIYFYLIIPVSSSRLLQDASMNHELSRTNYKYFYLTLQWCPCALFYFHVCMKLDTQMLNVINKIIIKSFIHSVCTLFA